MDISELRQNIDMIDQRIVRLFRERMNCAAEIADYKREHGLAVYDPEREAVLFEKIKKQAGDELGDYALSLYKTVTALSRDYQNALLEQKGRLCPHRPAADPSLSLSTQNGGGGITQLPMPQNNGSRKRCGLLGRKLSHSYSPLIHSHMGEYSYSLYEVEPDGLESFILGGGYDALNVTIPYKQEVMKYLDEISGTAKAIGAVNTVIRRPDGTLFGENTDLFGFTYMLSKADISIKGKKCLILGSGGAHSTVRYALRQMGAEEIITVSRMGAVNYTNVYFHTDTDIIINTTPVGMYPNNEACPIELSRFPELSGVVDLIYNPTMTRLLFDAKQLGIQHVGGLSMLCAQAWQAAELFLGNAPEYSRIAEAQKAVASKCQNIILVGMPGCGKTKISRALSDILGRDAIDTDALVIEARGKSIPEIFAEEGEEAFRAYEHEAVCEACKKSGVIIATGGGVPTREHNIRAMKQNGCVVYLRRPASELSRNGRPLSEGADLEAMFDERRHFYEGCADATVDVAQTPQDTARAIISALGIV